MNHPISKYKKVVIWGYPLHSHTHSYIHAAFYKAFKHLGYETYWFDDITHPQGFDYSNTLFLASTTGHEKYITLDASSTYILHNVDAQRYVEAGCKIFFIQVYTNDLYNNVAAENLQKITDYTILARFNDVNCLYMPWATDLLPHEIDINNATNNMDKVGKCVWIGSYGGNINDQFQNGSELIPYFNACEKEGIGLHRVDPWSTPISFEENVSLIRNAYLAPSSNGKWQKDQDYLPCRLFKNISYGHFGITNNAFAKQIFGDVVIYASDPVELFQKSIEAKNSPGALDMIKGAMSRVATQHTYINRINDILNALENG